MTDNFSVGTNLMHNQKNKYLTWAVAAALISGIAIGHFYPSLALHTHVLSQGFIELIKLFIVPVVFLTILSGMLGMKDLKKAGRIGLKSLLYFEVISTLALVLGIAGAVILQPGQLDMAMPAAAPQQDIPSSGFGFLPFLLHNTMLQVLLCALLLGIALHFSVYKTAVHRIAITCSDGVFLLLQYVMLLAPFAAFGGIAYTVGKFGLYTLVPLLKLVLSVYFTMAFFIMGILGAILYCYKKNIFRLLRLIREEILLVLGTSSSESALPSLMQKLEASGCSPSVVGLVIPSGYSFNLDGTSIYLSMSVLFISQLYHVPLSVMELLSIVGLLMITSKGAAGVTGSGFVILASTLAAFHKLPAEGLTVLLGVDKFMSEARAITNLVGNSVACAVIAQSEGESITFDSSNE